MGVFRRALKQICQLEHLHQATHARQNCTRLRTQACAGVRVQHEGTDVTSDALSFLTLTIACCCAMCTLFTDHLEHLLLLLR